MIDTQAKRQSIPGVGRPWKRGPAPDATKSLGWRVSVGNTYFAGVLEGVIGYAGAGFRVTAPWGFDTEMVGGFRVSKGMAAILQSHAMLRPNKPLHRRKRVRRR